MGPYAGVDYNSPYLIVKFVAIHPHYKGKVVELGRSLLLVEHICICLLISKTTNRNRRGKEGVTADLISFNKHFMEHKHEATPCLS
jgi:hypothetical protein